MGLSLPPELIDLIIHHLPHNAEQTLKNCALVARTWSGPSQRALFHHIDLTESSIVTQLHEHLIRFPHLQTLIRGLTISQHRADDDISLPAHLDCLASMLSLLSNLMKVEVKGYDFEDRQTRFYLNLIPNVLGNAPLVEFHIDVYSLKTFQRVFEILGETDITRLSLSGFNHNDDGPMVDSGSRLYLPSLEHIRLDIGNLVEEFRNVLTHHFALPNLKQCEICIDAVEELPRLWDVLLQGFPPLELFKLEMGVDYVQNFAWSNTNIFKEEDLYQPIPLAGLRFQHVHLKVNPQRREETLSVARKFIESWSSTFRALSDSKATIHFTELTFTLPDLLDMDSTLEDAWNSLDDSLAHTTFSGVRSIHLENTGEAGLITEAVYPDLADQIRLVLPRLASRGVLCFV